MTDDARALLGAVAACHVGRRIAGEPEPVVTLSDAVGLLDGGVYWYDLTDAAELLRDKGFIDATMTKDWRGDDDWSTAKLVPTVNGLHVLWGPR